MRDGPTQKYEWNRCTSVLGLPIYVQLCKWCSAKGDQIVMPKKLQKEMLDKAHEGHLGAAKSMARAREHMRWQGMNKAIDDMIDRCEVCAQFRHQQKKEPLMSTDLLDHPWQQVASDIFHCGGKTTF